MFSSTLFVVCLLAGLRKTTQPIFTKSTSNLAGKVVHGPRNKPLDYVGNPGHVTLGLGFG